MTRHVRIPSGRRHGRPLVNGCKTGMVNAGLNRLFACIGPARLGRTSESGTPAAFRAIPRAPRHKCYESVAMAKPHTTSDRAASDRADRMIASALRTLDVESGGIAALAADIRDGLGSAF